MRLSTRGRYGVRLMLDLALHYGQGPVLLKEIASRQEISEKYLWHLIPPLKNAGLINATRGPHGGYTLARPPLQITLEHIISVVEGPISLVKCVDNQTFCTRVDICIARDIWDEVSEKITDILASITLADMVERYHKRIETATYSI